MISLSEPQVFEVGDWVTWAFGPEDPNGPFAWMLPFKRYRDLRDPIEDRLLRYEDPPYEVVQVFSSAEATKVAKPHKRVVRYEDPLVSVGHPQFVRVYMYLKEDWGGPLRKIRTFSGMLFVRADPPRGRLG